MAREMKFLWSRVGPRNWRYEFSFLKLKIENVDLIFRSKMNKTICLLPRLQLGQNLAMKRMEIVVNCIIDT